MACPAGGASAPSDDAGSARVSLVAGSAAGEVRVVGRSSRYAGRTGASPVAARDGPHSAY